MRATLRGCGAAMLLLAAAGAGADPSAARPGFSVVELFTSEGCSSCPPADDALSAVAAEAQRESLPIYPLEWHVDYWDSLGWKDPYDSRIATERQYAYARALPSDVYTPQIVINGTVVPSWAGDRAGVDAAARSLLDQPARARLNLRVAAPGGPAGFPVEAAVSGAPAGSNLLLAVVESGLEATPNAGENAGRRLLHSRVVRVVAVLPAHSGTVTVTVPAGVDISRSRLIGIIQDPRSMRILGAAEAALTVTTGARISGRVVDGNGVGVAAIRIQACSGSICVPSETDTTGTFVIDGLAAGTWSLTVEGVTQPLAVSVSGRQDTRIE